MEIAPASALKQPEVAIGLACAPSMVGSPVPKTGAPSHCAMTFGPVHGCDSASAGMTARPTTPAASPPMMKRLFSTDCPLERAADADRASRRDVDPPPPVGAAASWRVPRLGATEVARFVRFRRQPTGPRLSPQVF